jgi:hypothetical protein
MGPLEFVERRIGAYVTFDVKVVAFLDVVAVDVAAQCDAHFGWILIDRIHGRRFVRFHKSPKPKGG